MKLQSINRYEAYKDSGVEWLGEAPAHWKIKRVKELGNLVLGKMLDNNSGSDKFLKPYLKSKNICWLTPNVNTVEEMFFSLHEISLYRVKHADLLFSEGGDAGKTSYWSGELDECYIQNSVHKFSVNRHNHSRYFLYLSFAAGHANFYDSIVNFVSIKHLTKEKLSRVIWLSPPAAEQKTIATYLDTKTAQIDRKIDLLSQKAVQYGKLKQSLINETVTRGLDKTVTMKDSEVEWIGEIPVHWGVFPLKDLASKSAGSFVDGPFGSDLKSDEYTDTGVPLIQLNNIGIGVHLTKNRKFISEAKALSLSKHRAYPDEIAIAKMAEPVARATVISKEFPMYVIVADCIKFKPDSRTSQAKFLSYALNTTGVKSQAEILSNGTTRIRINLGTTKILKVVTPPLPEQKAIAEYLDEKTAHIDRIVATINSQIDKLKELRLTLINDVVTGKIKVA
jgi:type I restriction enzyme S subunit